MNTQTRSMSPVRANPSRFLLALTLATWLLAGAGCIWFWFSPSNDLIGLEWLGSPLVGLGALAVVMTAYYLGGQYRHPSGYACGTGNSSDRCVTGYFTTAELSTGKGGGNNYGVVLVKLTE